MHSPTSRSSVWTTAPRVLGATALLGAMLTGASATAAPAPDTLTGGCVGDEGVTVVVDFTDLGGEIDVGCATGDVESGRDALELAGFTPADSMPGMICAINNFPDPCPEEFDGTFWSYWFAEPNGDWETYQVGADEAEPAPGDFEGWRYFDGSEGPQATPAMIAQVAEDGATDVDADDSDAETLTDDDADDSEPTEEPATDEMAAEESSGVSGGVIAAAGVAAALIIITVVLMRRRKSTMPDDN